ncbi:MAG: hypothetical protein A2W19_07715 [Spirochaetes bacterium RBG_16_49_21]|nr:MAG: hypothetical protein A2W19_07715 [Spirochaetes bacterium RBG_16_49_21]
MHCPKSIILLICMAVVVCSTACGNRTSEKKGAHTGKDLPEFSLKDPRGKAFTRKDILKNGAVFVVTAPILSNKKEQEDWAKYLKAMKHRNKGRLIFLQDMSPSSFKGKALSEMKRKSDPGIDPLLLIDPKGEMRRKLGVEKEDTIVLVYDKKGRASCGFRVFNK